MLLPIGNRRTPAEEAPVPVPAADRQYHPVVAAFRDATDRLEVTRSQLPRVLRVLQALVIEAERRGFAASTPRKASHREYHKPVWSGDKDGHVVLARSDVSVVLRLREDGVRGRAVYQQRYRSSVLDDWASPRRLPRIRGRCQGTITISILSPHSRSNRSPSGVTARRSPRRSPSGGVDGSRIEDRGGAPPSALELEEAKRPTTEMEAAMESAKLQHTEHLRADILDAQVAAWLMRTRSRLLRRDRG